MADFASWERANLVRFAEECSAELLRVRGAMVPDDTLTLQGVAAILHVNPRTLQNRYYRDPSCLPPPIKVPGQSRPIWLTADIRQWLEQNRQAE